MNEILSRLEKHEVQLHSGKRRRLSQFRGALPATVPYPDKKTFVNMWRRRSHETANTHDFLLDRG